MYTAHDCTDESWLKVNLVGQYLILKPDFLAPEYRDEKHQLVKAFGGFGCDPSKTGNAIFVEEVNNEKESYRIDRCDRGILGIAKDSIVAAHKEKYLN